MAEQSHRAEMSEAIRAQRERAGAARHVATPTTRPADPSPNREGASSTRGFLARLLGRR
jgi:hypothetical protein